MTRSLVWGIAVIIILGAAALAGRAAREPSTSTASIASPRPDTVLARCRAAGEAALDDPACRQAWDRARTRFFGGPAS